MAVKNKVTFSQIGDRVARTVDVPEPLSLNQAVSLYPALIGDGEYDGDKTSIRGCGGAANQLIAKMREEKDIAVQNDIKGHHENGRFGSEAKSESKVM